MDRYDAHESHIHPHHYLECPSWCNRQPYHLPSPCSPPFVQDANDNLGAEFLQYNKFGLTEIGCIRATYQEPTDGNQ